MRKLNAWLFVTLDGVVEAPENWVMPDDQMFDEQTADYAASDALLLGRRTYEIFAASWPKRGSEIPNADWITTPEVRGLDDARVAGMAEHDRAGRPRSRGCWATQARGRRDHHAERQRRSAVLAPPRGAGRRASPHLHPIVRGSGERLFDDLEEEVALQLTDSRSTTTASCRSSTSRAHGDAPDGGNQPNQWTEIGFDDLSRHDDVVIATAGASNPEMTFPRSGVGGSRTRGAAAAAKIADVAATDVNVRAATADDAIAIPPLLGVQFTDLHGAGAAKTMESLVAALSGYALRAAVIVDREGDMADYVEALIERGTLPSEDVLLFEDSLKSCNFSPAELIELVADLGRQPPAGREPAALELDADTLTAFHADQREKAGKEKPRLVDSLRVLARRQEHGAVNFSKPELAEGMARRMLAELDEARPGSFESVFERRPVLRFVYGRIVGALNRPVPVL